MHRRRSRWLACALGGALVVGGCATNAAPRPQHALSWTGLRAHGYGDAVLAVSLLSQPDMEERTTGYVALIDPDGHARVVSERASLLAPVASRDGVLCVPDTKRYYRITADAAETRAYGEGGRVDGHWTGVRADGSCFFVSNDGVAMSEPDATYATGLHWTGSTGKQATGLVPDVPAGVGITDEAAWVVDLGSSSTLSGQLALYRTDFKNGTTSKAMTWPVWQGQIPGTRAGIRYMSGGGSDVFAYEGKLFVLEELDASDARTGGPAHIVPGAGGQVRLTTIDPARKTYRSSFVTYYGDGIERDLAGGGSVAAIATHGGYLHQGAIYRVSADGAILAVDLDHEVTRTVGHVSESPRLARDAVAAQAGHLLVFVVEDRRWNTSLETYDLDTGRLVSTKPITGLHSLLDGNKVEVTSAATLAPPGP